MYAENAVNQIVPASMSELLSLRAEVSLWVSYSTVILNAEIFSPSTSYVRIDGMRQLSVGMPGVSCLEVDYPSVHQV